MNDHILRSALAVLLGLSVTGAALAQPHHDANHAGSVGTISSSMKQADGTIRKVDVAAGKLKIAHGPLEGLGMPPMTMAFRVAEQTMLEMVKVGDRIRFVPAQVGGDLIVTSLELVH